MADGSSGGGRPWLRRLFMIVVLLALGGVMALATEPLLPEAWTAWITAVQERIGTAATELAEELQSTR